LRQQSLDCLANRGFFITSRDEDAYSRLIGIIATAKPAKTDLNGKDDDSPE